MKKFSGMQLKTPGSLLVSRPKANLKLSLTPIIEDLRELALSSKKKNCKDDFEVSLRNSAKVIEMVEVKVDTISENRRKREPTVAKQLNELFKGESLAENQMLQGKFWL
jgi:hypothetical protein